MGLLLEAVDVQGPGRWRWVLRDVDSGTPIAERAVLLDLASDEARAAGDLYEYARWHASPGHRDADEARILRQVGIWLRRSLLGERIVMAIAAAAPVTVRVMVPDAIGHVLLWPLELALFDGKFLSARGDVAFVYDFGREALSARTSGRAGPVRLLAVFSLPARTGMTADRRERYRLGRLVRRLVDRDGVAVTLRSLEYGVTRQRLAAIAAEGWDIVHLSSHGNRGRFGLQQDDGTPDWVPTDDLVELLRPTGARLMLVSSCRSAAEGPARPTRLVGRSAQEASTEAASVTGLARGLARDLGCAVVATRYPITSEHMTTLNEVFYEKLLRDGESVAQAAAQAIAESSRPPWMDRPIYGATPGVFGSTATRLVLPAPRDDAWTDPAARRMAGFPDEPERFVGRIEIMAAASGVLLGTGKQTAVALHGMPGIGTTSCALELAWQHQAEFTAVAFWRPPQRDAGMLEDFAAVLHVQLAHQFPAPPRGPLHSWKWYAARLAAAMRSSRVLLVIDEVDRLLAPDGAWRDPGWAPVLNALVSRRAKARLLLAGHAVPPLRGPWLLPLPVDLLTQAEADELVRELPALRARRRGANVGSEDRKRVEAALRAAGRHPALLTLMDEAARNDEPLDARFTPTTKAIAAWRRATWEGGQPTSEATETDASKIDADSPDSGYVLRERADEEAARGRLDAAVDLMRASLRVRYADNEYPQAVAYCHYHLAELLGEAHADRAEQVAHYLAAAVIYRLGGADRYQAGAGGRIARVLLNWPPPRQLPDTAAEMIRLAEQTDGVRLEALLATIAPDEHAVDQAISRILPPEATTRDLSVEKAILDIGTGIRRLFRPEPGSPSR